MVVAEVVQPRRQDTEVGASVIWPVSWGGGGGLSAGRATRADVQRVAERAAVAGDRVWRRRPEGEREQRCVYFALVGWVVT